MGNGISSGGGSGHDGGDGASGQRRNVLKGVHGGFRVVRLNPNSIARDVLRLEPLLEYIVNIDLSIPDGSKTLGRYLDEKSSQNCFQLGIYHALKKSVRRVTLPNQDPGNNIRLGATVRFEPIDSVENEGLEIVRITPGSPADRAGLKAQRDWILASATDGVVVFRSRRDLENAIQQSVRNNVPLGLMIFDSATFKVREIFVSLNAPEHNSPPASASKQRRDPPTNSNNTNTKLLSLLGAEVIAGGLKKFASPMPSPMSQGTAPNAGSSTGSGNDSAKHAAGGASGGIVSTDAPRVFYAACVTRPNMPCSSGQPPSDDPMAQIARTWMPGFYALAE